MLVPARWVPVNEYWIVEDWFCSAFPADAGSVIVSRRWSVLPAVVAVRFDSDRLDPITARDASTVEVVPAQV